MASDSSADVNFVELLSFLRQYQWVHDVHLTKLFEDRVLDSMPVEWKEAFSTMSLQELNNLPFYCSGDFHHPQPDRSPHSDTLPLTHPPHQVSPHPDSHSHPHAGPRDGSCSHSDTQTYNHPLQDAKPLPDMHLHSENGSHSDICSQLDIHYLCPDTRSHLDTQPSGIGRHPETHPRSEVHPEKLSSLDTHQQPVTLPQPDSDTPPQVHIASHPDVLLQSDTHPHLDTHQHPCSHPQTDMYQNLDSDAHPLPDIPPHFDTHPQSETHPHLDTHQHPCSHPQTDMYSDAHPLPDIPPHSDTHPQSDTRPHTDTHSASLSVLPNSLLAFLHKSFHFSLPRDQATDRLPQPSPVPTHLSKGMSPKKHHEVLWMASLVNQVARQADCNVVVDVGSGLGYLGQVLHQNYSWPIIGLESSASHSEGAEKRAAKQGLQCTGIRSVPFLLTQDEASIQEFYDLIHSSHTIQPCQHSSHSHDLAQISQPCQLSKSDFLHPPAHDGMQDSVTAVQEGLVPQGTRKLSNTDINCEWKHNDNDKQYTLKHSDIDKQCALKHSDVDKRCTLKHSDGDLQKNSDTDKQNVQKHNHTDTHCKPKGCCSNNHSAAEWAQASSPGVKIKVDRREAGVRVCLIGLHCCGDLTPTMIHLYSELQCVRALCCVSCCYHKMQHNPGSGRFYNFPMSAAAQKAYTEVAACSKVSSPEGGGGSQSVNPPSSPAATAASLDDAALLTPCSLRLAAQETRTRWHVQTEDDHNKHVRHVAYRAVLELLFRGGSCGNRDRKQVRKLDYSSFDKFVQSYLAGAKAQNDEKTIEDQLNTWYGSLKEHFSLIEPFTSLQVVLQPVLEAAVMWDRQQWLKEKGLTSHLVPVFDEQVSPRNLALVSLKH